MGENIGSILLEHFGWNGLWLLCALNLGGIVLRNVGWPPNRYVGLALLLFGIVAGYFLYPEHATAGLSKGALIGGLASGLDAAPLKLLVYAIRAALRLPQDPSSAAPEGKP